MKMRNIVLSVLMLTFMMYGCGNNLFEFLSDEDSTDAKDYVISRDLDKGDFDSVLNNENASPLDRSAAYLGLAGFDINDILDRMIDAEDVEDDLALYFETLLPSTTLENKQYIQSAVNELSSEGGGMADTDPEINFHYAIALIIDAIMDFKNLIDGGGQDLLLEGIDSDGNGVVDVVEAGECALEFISVAEDAVMSDPNPLTNQFLQNNISDYNCTNSSVVLEISDPAITGTLSIPLDVSAEWTIAPVISGNSISGLSLGAAAQLSGIPPAHTAVFDILVTYGTLSDIEVPLVSQFGTSLRDTVRSLIYSLPNNPDNSVVEAMDMLWDDINDADSPAALGSCGVALPFSLPENNQDSLETGRITALEMAVFLLCNFN